MSRTTMVTGAERMISPWDTSGQTSRMRRTKVCGLDFVLRAIFDVFLEADILARLSIYNVPSSAPAHLSLLPRFLSPRISLSNTLILIVIDWTRPWTFVQQLEVWFHWIEKWLDGDTSREMQVAKELGRTFRRGDASAENNLFEMWALTFGSSCMSH